MDWTWEVGGRIPYRAFIPFLSSNSNMLTVLAEEKGDVLSHSIVPRRWISRILDCEGKRR